TLTEELGVEIHTNDGVLIVLRRTEHEAVVLAAQSHRGRGLVIRLEHFDRAPAVLWARGDDARDARLLEPQTKLASPERQAIARASHVSSAPLASESCSQTVHRRLVTNGAVLGPVLGRPARGLRG